jgi:hypothetical protein
MAVLVKILVFYQEDCSSKPAPGKEFRRPYLEKTHHRKRAGRVANVVEHLPTKLEFKPKPPKSQCPQKASVLNKILLFRN